MTVSDTLAGLDPASRGPIERDFQRLRVEFGDLLDPGVIERCLEEGLSVVSDAEVAEYVPLLAYRFARERLTDMADAKLWSVPPERW
jgi:hypothetical protein